MHRQGEEAVVLGQPGGRDFESLAVGSVNASNNDTVLGDVFDNLDLCEAAQKAWEDVFDRKLAHEKRRQAHHCDHIGEYKRYLTCTFPGGFTGERESTTDSFPDPGEVICAPTP